MSCWSTPTAETDRQPDESLLGLLPIVTMLRAPHGLWGVIQRRTRLRLFPVQRTLVVDDGQEPGP